MMSRLTAVILAAVLASAAPAQDPDIKIENAPKLEGKILLTHETSTNTSDILVLDLGEWKSKTLVSRFGRSKAASWSPDGKKIAFHSDANDGHNQLYVLDLEQPKQAAERLIDGKSSDEAPQWHPDGKQILFQRERSTKNATSILILDLESKEIAPPVLDEFRNSGPRWSYDGRSVVFARRSYRKSDWRIQKLDPDKAKFSEVPTVDGPCVRPAMSPDGESIVFCHGGGNDGSGKLRLAIFKDEKTKMLTDGKHRDLDPVWVSDDRVMFVREAEKKGERFSLLLINVKTQEVLSVATSAKPIRNPAWLAKK